MSCIALLVSSAGETCYLETDLNGFAFLRWQSRNLRVTNYVVLCYVYSVYIMSSGRDRHAAP